MSPKALAESSMGAVEMTGGREIAKIRQSDEIWKGRKDTVREAQHHAKLTSKVPD